MSKRSADRKLNHDNWDEEDESEDPGTFAVASVDVVKTRQIKKAKRKLANNGEPTEDSDEKPSAPFKAFSGFTGFTSGGPSFNFKKQDTQSSSVTGTDSDSTVASSLSTQSVGPFKSSSDIDSESAYLRQLRNLNESVSVWVKDHVNRNPYCLLTPVFRDYDKHLNELHRLFPDEAPTPSISDKPTVKFGATAAASQVPGCGGNLFGDKPVKFNFSAGNTFGTKTNDVGELNKFSFGAKANGTEDKPISAPMFGFLKTSEGAKVESSKEKEGEASSDACTAVGGQGDDEEYVPPKNEVKSIEEEGSFYTKRCKLFFKKGENWKEKGVGNLHLKKIADKGTQLVVRADTTLGNILLNIMVTPNMPLSLMGNNNVMMACIPNPPLDIKNPDTQPIPMLLRVKGIADAEELLAQIKKSQE